MLVGQDIILIVPSRCVCCCCYHYSTYAVILAIDYYVLHYETSDYCVFVLRHRKAVFAAGSDRRKSLLTFDTDH